MSVVSVMCLQLTLLIVVSLSLSLLQDAINNAVKKVLMLAKFIHENAWHLFKEPKSRSVLVYASNHIVVASLLYNNFKLVFSSK